MSGIIFLFVVVVVALLVAVCLAKLLRMIAELASGSGASFSRVIWGSCLLAAVPFISPVLLAFATVTAGFYNDRLVRKLSTIAVITAFGGVAAVLISTILLIRPAARGSLSAAKLRSILLINAVGLVTAFAVLWIFRGLIGG